LKRVGESVVKHVEAMVEMKRRGAVAFEYGNNIRKLADLTVTKMLLNSWLCATSS